MFRSARLVCQTRLGVRMRGLFSSRWYFVPSVCVLVGLYFSVSEYFNRSGRNEAISIPRIISEELSFWLLWAALSPVVFTLVRRYPLEKPVRFRGLLVHVSAALLFAIICTGQQLLVSHISTAGPRPASYSFLSGIIPNVIIYSIILAIYLPFLYHERYRNELLKATRLDAQLSQARLQALTMQLHPHFLFNTLHSISALTLKNDTRGAVKMINRLSEFLRVTLDRRDTQIITLGEETDFARRYLEIELIRFGDRLTVEWDIDPRVVFACVPNLILQPLVENAMHHSVNSDSGLSRVKIVASLRDGRVLMEVRDDGKDPDKISGQTGSTGLGLRNTRERLSAVYGEDCRFSLSREENEWTVARIDVPFLRAETQPAGGAG
jgi:two-component system LytT family sensor kinase